MSNERISILDRSKYSTRTITTFNILGAYVIDIYYNYLYQESIKLKNDGAKSSITEAYKHNIYMYVSSIDRNKKSLYKKKTYQQLIEGIRNYFGIWNGLNTITTQDCIDKIVKEFIPEDYFDVVDKDKKRDLFYLVINNTIQSFGKIIATDYIVQIIDDHENRDNIEFLKETMLDMLLLQRNTMYKKFLNEKVGNVDKVDKSIIDKIQADAVNLINERNQLQKSLQEMGDECNVRTKQLSQVLKKYRNIENSHKKLELEYSHLKGEYEKLKNSYSNSDQRYAVLQSNIASLEEDYLRLEDENSILINKINEYEENKTNLLNKKLAKKASKDIENATRQEVVRNDNEVLTNVSRQETTKYNETLSNTSKHTNEATKTSRQEADKMTQPVSRNDRESLEKVTEFIKPITFDSTPSAPEMDVVDDELSDMFGGFSQMPKKIMGSLENELSEMM